MHAGDGNAVFQAHQFRQHLGALDDRKLEAMRLGNLGIISGDGRTGDAGLGALDVLRPMALEALRSQIDQLDVQIVGLHDILYKSILFDDGDTQQKEAQ